MSRKMILSLVLAVSVIGYVSSINADNPREIKRDTDSELFEWVATYKTFDKNKNYIFGISEEEEINAEIEEEVVEEIQRPHIKGIDLEDEILDYIWQVSIEKDLSYELILAFAKVESNFTANVRSKTSDSGMLQINIGTEKWISEQLGLEKYDLMDARTSIDFGVFYITYLRDQYRSRGLSEEDVFYYTVTAYNRGIKGANKYIQRHGMNVKYTERIIYYKDLYEQGGELS